VPEAMLDALTTPDSGGRDVHHYHDHGKKKRWRRDYD
jgi:hypothetical protein